MMPGYGGGMGGWSWMFMSFGSLLFLVLVGVGVWLLARASSPTGGRPTAAPTGSAREVLAERFARGEIDADEYRKRVAVLDGR